MGRITQHRPGPASEKGIVSIRVSNEVYNSIVDTVLANARAQFGPRTVTEWILEAVQEKFAREHDLAKQREAGVLQSTDDGNEEYFLPGARQW